jgi:Exopolysaccharide biosynthesis protein YbjH
MHRRFSVICYLTGILLTSCVDGHAEDFHNALSLQGFTGLLNIPNAAVTDEGKFYTLFSNQIDSRFRSRSNRQENYFFSVGLFSFVEIGGRLTEAPGGANDLSGNFKVKVPSIPRGYFLPDIAFGMQDASGAKNSKGNAVLLHTKYIVASEDIWRFRLSLGYGTGPERMKGVFGGAEFKVCDWLYLLGENDASETNVGLRLVTPSVFGYPVNLQATAKSSLDHRPGHMEYGLGLQFPLGFDRHNKSPVPQVTGEPPGTGGEPPVPSPQSPVPGPQPLVPSPDSRPPAEAPSGAQARVPSQLALLRESLVEASFQNVRVGAKKDQLLVVEYENSRFNHNELDGLGVVAGIVVETIPAGYDTLRLVMKKKDIRVVQFSAPLKAFGDFLSDPAKLEEFNEQLRISADVDDEDGIEYVAGYGYPSWLRSSLVLYPGLKTLVGTEAGAFDYVLSLKLDYFLNTWKGSVLNARWDVPLSWSENFDDGKLFRNGRNGSQLERLMLFQAVKPAPSLMFNFGGGMVVNDGYGTLNELMWSPGDGRHRFRFKQAYIANKVKEGPYQSNNVYLGSYRYHFAPLDVDIEGTAGKFLSNDKGGVVELKRFFGDTAFSVYYKNSQTAIQGHIQAAGVQVAFPLTPRRDMKPYPLQVRGTEEWSYSQETRIATGNSFNSLYDPLAINPQPSFSLDRVFYNRDRLNEPYIRKNLLRLRDAYIEYR